MVKRRKADAVTFTSEDVQAGEIQRLEASLRQARSELHQLAAASLRMNLQLTEAGDDLVDKDATIRRLEAKVSELQTRNDNQRDELKRRAVQLETMTRAHDEMIENYNDVVERSVIIEEMPEVHPLVEWWMRTARDEVDRLVEKATEYGGGGRAVDLTEIGSALRIAGVGFGKEHRGQPTEGDTQELGVYFYLVGKFARWTAAIAENRPVSDDTLTDIGIYVRMAQRIRQSGGWPV